MIKQMNVKYPIWKQVDLLKNMVRLLVGGRKEEEVITDQVEMMFLEASALTGDGVEDMFFKCARSILSKIETGQIDPERSGSGVQFGDSSLRRMAQRTRIRKKERSCCSF
jgi:Ras-related protein Rab-4B